jgi:hypothetical protein
MINKMKEMESVKKPEQQQQKRKLTKKKKKERTKPRTDSKMAARGRKQKASLL